MRSTSTQVGPNISIEVPLAPFELPELDEDNSISTSLQLEFIDLPHADPSKFDAKEYRFPVNPTDGYIEASIYLDHRHHIVDVTALRFGEAYEDGIKLDIELEFIFEHEGLGDFGNTRWICKTVVKSSN